MILYFSEYQVLQWLEHVQQNSYDDPSKHFQIPTRLLTLRTQGEGKAEENMRYPGLMELDADIQRLIKLTYDVRLEQPLRSLMEIADLICHRHPFCVRLRDFARDRKQPQRCG